MDFILPKLKYSFSDLEPYIDAKTMEIHYTKHHQSYIDNLKKALEGETDLLSKDIEYILGNLDKVPEVKRQAVINNGGGHANHSFFWNILTPPNGGNSELPEGEFKTLLNSTFGDLVTFKERFGERAMSVFGSGWCFLIATKDKKLELKRHSFQNSPLMFGNTPILGIDLWEHAYYLNYQNRKIEYINAFWNIIDWKQIEANFSNI